MTATGTATVNRVCSGHHCSSYINTIITCISRDYNFGCIMLLTYCSTTTYLARADAEVQLPLKSNTSLVSSHSSKDVSQGCRHRSVVGPAFTIRSIGKSVHLGDGTFSDVELFFCQHDRLQNMISDDCAFLSQLLLCICHGLGMESTKSGQSLGDVTMKVDVKLPSEKDGAILTLSECYR